MGEGGLKCRIYEYQLVTTQNKNKDLTVYYKVVYWIIFIVITTSRIIPSTLSVRTCAASFPRALTR